MVRRGANDYLLKSNLTRLPVAVERALGEAEQKRDRAAVREQLVVAERMATVGSLAAGLVHDINNPLSALLFNLEYIADGLARGSSGIVARRPRCGGCNSRWGRRARPALW